MQRKMIIISVCGKNPEQVKSAVVSLTWWYSTNALSDWM